MPAARQSSNRSVYGTPYCCDTCRHFSSSRSHTSASFTLPAGAAQKKGFIDEAQADFTNDTSHSLVATGLPALREVLPDATLFTFPADAPTRRLDYIGYGPALALEEARVLAPPPGPWSDHLPIRARWRLAAP